MDTGSETGFAVYSQDDSCGSTMISANSKWSSSHSAKNHPNPNDRYRNVDDSVPSEYEQPGCGSTLDSSGSEFEKTSPQHLEESVYAPSSQAVPPASADISISHRDATIPTRGYAVLADLSKCSQHSVRKLNLCDLSGKVRRIDGILWKRMLTDGPPGTDCRGFHQFDTIRDAAHEYDTPLGGEAANTSSVEKCRHKLLGTEEEDRMVPSADGLTEVNITASEQNDDDGCRVVPGGTTEMDSIVEEVTFHCSLENRFFKSILRSHHLETRSCSDTGKCDCDFVSKGILTERRKIEYVMQETRQIRQSAGALSPSHTAAESAPINMRVGIRAAHVQVEEASDETWKSSKQSFLSPRDDPKQTVHTHQDNIAPFPNFKQFEHKLRSTTDVAIQTEPLLEDALQEKHDTDTWAAVRMKRSLAALNLIEPYCKRRVSVTRSTGIQEEDPAERLLGRGWQICRDDTCGPDSQLVETSIQVITPRERKCPDGGEVSAACEGITVEISERGDADTIDLPSPAFKWNDGELPRSDTTQAFPARPNKRIRLRLGLSKRTRPPPLHRTKQTVI